MREEIVEWILYHPNVVPLFLSFNAITIFNPESNKKESLKNISVRDIHNDMIKPFHNGGLAIAFASVTSKVLICYITLRSFIPPQVCKMNPKLR